MRPYHIFTILVVLLIGYAVGIYYPSYGQQLAAKLGI